MKQLGNRDVHSDARTLGALLGRVVWLTTPLTSGAFDAGDAFSTTAKTLIDLSASFGAPAGIQAVYVYASVRDNNAVSVDSWLCLSPNDTAGSGIVVGAGDIVDRAHRTGVWVPCNADGDIYYQTNCGGAGSMRITLQIWGYQTRG